MTSRIALLVDGDNISAAHLGRIRQIAEKLGRADFARVYGNALTAPGWLTADGFRFIHSGTGKNATDLLLTIDAMELALTAGIEGFVLVTSDGDFTHLANRLREHGLSVTGIGEAKAPSAFRAACTTFHQIDPAAARPAPKIALVVVTTAMAKSQKPEPKTADALCRNIQKIIVENGPNAEGMMIARLAAAMHARHQVRISQLPEKTWRGFLCARPELFDLDPKGPDAKVRLRSTVPNASLRLAKN